MPVTIHAEDRAFFKIFCNDFAFSIPPYQRPYAWKTDQAADLYGDLLFACNGQDPVDDMNPYFLGSIVLIKAEGPEAQIVDGQQRLTTVTILLAVLRRLAPPEYAKEVTKYLYEAGDLYLGTPNRYRIRLRPRDEDFFRRYVQDERGIDDLLQSDSAQLTDSQKTFRRTRSTLMRSSVCLQRRTGSVFCSTL